MRAMCSLFSLAKRFKDFRVPRALLGQFQPARAHDRGQVTPRFFELFVYYNIIKLVAMRDLVARVPQPALDGLLAVLAPPPQAMLELAEDRRRRKDEDAHRVGKGLRTCRAPCQSISSMMSKPLARAPSIHLRE